MDNQPDQQSTNSPLSPEQPESPESVRPPQGFSPKPPEPPSLAVPPQPQSFFEPQPTIPEPTTRKRGSKKHLFMLAGAVLVVVALLAGYAFAFYLPNRPENIFKAGLERTGQATDKLLDYADQQQSKSYKSVSFDGSAKVVSPSGSFDASLSGASNMHGNATLSVDADLMGEKIHGDLRSIIAKDQTTPDIYLKVTGAKKLLSGLNMQSLDDKWLVVDHTIFDTFLSAAGADPAVKKDDAPTYAQVHDAVLKVQAVNKQYLFTTDRNTAVLSSEKFLGKDQLNGRASYHYRTGYNKAHLQAYVDALKKALDDSQLNTWAKASQNKSASELINLNNMKTAIDHAKSDYKFDLWIDAQTKLVNQLTFANATDGAGAITFAQNYTGGSKYPFTITASGTENGKPLNAKLDLTIDSNTHKVALDFSSTSSDDSGKTTITAKFSAIPSDKTVDVTAPKDAKSLNDLIAEILAAAQSSVAGSDETVPVSSLLTQT